MNISRKQSNGKRDEVSVGFSKNGAREVVEHETVYDASIDVDVPPASTATGKQQFCIFICG